MRRDVPRAAPTAASLAAADAVTAVHAGSASACSAPRTDRTRRVLLVHDLAIHGGGQMALLDAAEVLRGDGHEVHVACPAGWLAEAAQAQGSPWHELTPTDRQMLTPRLRVPRLRAARARIRGGRALAALATAIDAEVVHTWSLVVHLDALAMGRVGPSVVWHLNELNPPMLFAGRLPDAVIGVSDAALASSRWRRGAQRRSWLVPNGVDLDRFRPPTQAEREMARADLDLGDQHTIITVARLDPAKRIAAVIEAAAACAQPPVVLVAGGRLDDAARRHRRHLRTLALGRAVDVRFLAPDVDVARALWAADVAVLASRSEALPYALIEAAATGLPLVAVDAGGCAEILAGGSTGHGVPSGEPFEIAAAMDALATDPDRRSTMGAAGRALVADRYDRHRLGDRLRPAYAALGAGGR